ncbi:hypothetical protein RhiirA4_464912 [Rhizophagus irregularis]|uniref:Uncharacterized protein n=1 Tax=Rhizophagus irregularis TaxID=588596 RepID=A0A2I1GR30_9GLOM|nr:hypothetical protein RhiirA4_464912 [Rhizophagus irregularis]
MRYTKGSNTGEIFSKYIQKKAVNYIETTILYKTSIDSKNIQKINQFQQNHIFSLKKKFKSLYGKVSKYNQLHKQIKLKAKNPFKVTKIIEWLIDEKPDKWFSARTLVE